MLGLKQGIIDFSIVCETYPCDVAKLLEGKYLDVRFEFHSSCKMIKFIDSASESTKNQFQDLLSENFFGFLL